MDKIPIFTLKCIKISLVKLSFISFGKAFLCKKRFYGT